MTTLTWETMNTGGFEQCVSRASANCAGMESGSCGGRESNTSTTGRWTILAC